MPLLETARLSLEPITLDLVEAVFRSDVAALEKIARAKIPSTWPGKGLVERAFSASLEAIREDPDKRLWGDSLMIVKEDGARFVIGSVIFHGRPDDGMAEVGYGVEERWQNKGLASEGTKACVAWALEQPGIVGVTATTPPWHAASIRVLEKSGLVRICAEEHDTLGEVLRFERRKG